MADRDRDAEGRPRNSRPRDGLGRPLPRGEQGVPVTPDDLDLSPRQTLEMAQDLLNRGMPFHAHEVLEARWKSCPQAERDLWQGLAQLAVGITHQLRGNTTGAITLIGRGAKHMRPYASQSAPARVDEVDVQAILDWADAALARLQQGQDLDGVAPLWTRQGSHRTP